ncbi:zinc-dependent alcohol dehydrogenase family protein [Luteimonas panaciterrae]|uniref:zinc-dependent alcohol dehydrogenase family protein n=1 Tax=Luteimonas panaciterrae TaxID=363885 RepID=UPI001CF9C4A9|nr:NAD(P)-dependent alcohol dehydrogenase [Luteimonas panaciterrae]
MDAYELQGHTLDSLRRLLLPTPSPGPGEVVVRVEAASVNYRDYALATGRYQSSLPRPFVPLSDGVGRIEAVGEGVEDLRIGDRVVGLYATAWQDGPFRSAYHASKLGGPLDGWLAQYIRLPANAALRAPEFLDVEQVSVLPVSGLTAWTALRRLQLRPGAHLLVQGTGSVSLMALQLAVADGIDVIATTSDEAKAELLRTLGARAVIDYKRTPDLAAVVRDLTDGRGVDGIVDVVGGNALLALLDAAADNAHIAIVGFLQGFEVNGNLIAPIMSRQLNVHGVSVGGRRDLEDFLAAVERHRIEPVVGAVHGFDDAVAAIASIGSNRAIGKPVIRMD